MDKPWLLPALAALNVFCAAYQAIGVGPALNAGCAAFVFAALVKGA